MNCYKRGTEIYWQARHQSLVDAFKSYPGLPGRDQVPLEHTSIRIYDLTSPETMSELEGADGVILSGSTLNVSAMDGEMEEKPALVELEGFIRRARVPLLGICFGHQLIGHAFGCTVGEYSPGEKEPAEWGTIGMLRVGPDFDLLRRIPGYRDGPVDVSVEWKHKEEIKVNDVFERQFLLYASTSVCKIQAIKHIDKPLYGLQFHPETRNMTVQRNGKSPRQDGLAILHGFLDIVIDAANSRQGS